MHSIPFTLVSTESPDRILAFGLEIVRDGNTIEAITYRREPHSGSTLFGVHASAESACHRYGIITPVTLEYGEQDAVSSHNTSAPHD